MKKIIATLSIITLLTVLVACKTEENDVLEGGDISDSGSYIFTPDSELKIVYDEMSEDSGRVVSYLYGVFGAFPERGVYSDIPKSEHEILIGYTDRELSSIAYKQLERLRDDEKDVVGYLIYSDGKSIAIAYDDDEYEIGGALTCAVDYLLNDIISDKTSLVLSKGVVHKDMFNIIDYQEEIDNKMLDEEWLQFRTYLKTVTDNGDEIADAIKYYYDTICTDNVISWFANLYDPVIGGFYYSNSGRNTVGFLPDAESTSQALNFLKSSGMTKDVSGSIKEAIPEWMKNQIICFLKSLQDPETGYFYHPQWTVESVNANVSRRSRDMNRATDTLEALGSAPTYNAPNGAKGDGILPDGTTVDSVEPLSSITPLTGKLNTPTASAVSKIKPAASVASHLVSDVTFKEYLADFLERTKLPSSDSRYRSFYSIGNTISAQLNEIKARDEQLKAEGEKYSLGSILVEWLTENQNKETGLWGDGINYAATNALTKIVYDYTCFGYVLPNADLAVESCIQMLFSEEKEATIVYVYNLWYSLNKILQNLESYGRTSAELALREKTRLRLLELAPEAIVASANKQLAFKKEDGSLSYTPSASASTSQGLSVAVPNTNEGDVNATTIGTFNTINECISALGLSGKVPKCSTKADRLRYISILNDLGAIIKDDVNTDISVYDFEDDTLENPPIGAVTANLKSGVFKVVEDTYGGGSEKAVLFSTVAGDYETVKITCQPGIDNASCFTFESDFCVCSADEGNVMQLILHPYVYMLAFDIADGRVNIREASSTTWANSKETDLCVSAGIGEWFNLKIEYYVGDADTVRIIVYFNGAPVAVTDNYMDVSGAKLKGEESQPSSKLTHALLVGITKKSMDILMDNMYIHKSMKIYKPLDTVEKSPPINIDSPTREKLIYSFDDGLIPNSFGVIQGDNPPVIEAENSSDNRYIKLSGVEKNKIPSSVSIPINVRSAGAYCVSFEGDIKVDATKKCTVLRIYYRAPGITAYPVICFDLSVFATDTGMKVGLFEAANGVVGSLVANATADVGSKFKLRIDYHEKESVSLIYINDTLVGMSDAVCTNSEKYQCGVLELSGLSGNSYDLCIDNLVFERNTNSFFNESKPKIEEKVYDFTTDEGVELKDGAAISNQRLVFGNKGSAATFPLNERTSAASLTNVKADISGISSNNGTYRLTLSDKTLTPIVSFELVMTDGSVTLREYYAGGVGAEISKTKVYGSFKLNFCYYFTENKLCVYVDGICVGVISLTYLRDNELLNPAYLVVQKAETGDSIYFDNLVAENILDIYRDVEASNTLAPDNNGFDFENSYIGAFPEGMKYTEASKGADISFKGVNTGTKESPVYSKFLSIHTTPGANDHVTFYMNESDKIKSAVVAVFEADVIFDSDPISSDTSFQIHFRTDSGEQAWRPVFTFNNEGSVVATDYKAPNQSIKCYLAKEGELFKLRIEYVADADGIMVNLFVNGKYMATSTVYQSDLPIAAENITAVRFYATAATTADVLLDNVKLYHSNEQTPINEESGDNESDSETQGPSDSLDGGGSSYDGNGWTEEQQNEKGEANG